MKRNDMHTKHIPIVISSCCVLHNLCEIHGESFNGKWLNDNNECQQPVTVILSTSSANNSAQDI